MSFPRTALVTTAIVSASLLALSTDKASAQAAGEWRDAEHMYGAICHYCHDTGVGPVLFGRELSTDLIHSRIRNGFGPMPPFKPSELSEDDVAKLAEWLHASKAPAPSDK